MAKHELIKVEQVVEALQPMQMIKTCKHLKTVQDVVKSKVTALSKLSNDIGAERLQALIELHLWQLNSSLNLNNKLNEIQVMEIAVEIMSVYYYLSMEDIYLVFRKAKRGEFGKLYGSISMPDIFLWFDKYNEERTNVYVEMNTANRHTDHSPRQSDKDSEAMHIARLTEYKKNVENDNK